MIKDDFLKIRMALKTIPLRKKIILTPFMLCVLLLVVLGKMCHLTYKEISVIFNLWVQGIILLLSSFLPLSVFFYKVVEQYTLTHSLLCGFFVVYAAINTWAFFGMCRHYGIDKNYAFDLCVYDLERIAASWGMSYYMVNLLIFILFYLMIIAINVMLAHYVLFVL